MLKHKKLITLSVVWAFLEITTITIRVLIPMGSPSRDCWIWILLMDDLVSIAFWVIGWHIAEELIELHQSVKEEKNHEFGFCIDFSQLPITQQWEYIMETLKNRRHEEMEGKNMVNLIARVKKIKHCTGGYLSICDYKKNVHHMFVGFEASRAWVFSSVPEARERIVQFCHLNPDYEASDFVIEKIK